MNEEGGKAEYVVGVGIDDEGTGGRDEVASGEENMVVDLAIQGKDFEKPRMISWFDVTQSISKKDRIMADSVGVDLPTVHFYQDVSHSDLAKAQSALTASEGDAVPQVASMKEGLRFDTLKKLKFFLMDHAVRHHRPFKVTHPTQWFVTL